MPPQTTSYPYVGSNPAQGRSMISVAGGVSRADSADAHGDCVGFGWSNSGGTAVRCVDVGQVWAAELDPASPNITTTGVKMMVTSDGLHKAFAVGDTGLCAGESAPVPADVIRPSDRQQTFTSTKPGDITRRYCWMRSAPITVT